jgi:hypothetical protein
MCETYNIGIIGFQVEACFNRDYDFHYYKWKWRIRNKDFIEERRNLIKLVSLQDWLGRKEEYLVMVLQYKPRIFNSILARAALISRI